MENARGNLQNSRPELNKSKGRQDDGPHSCATSYISAGDDSKTKTLIEYNNDETLEIKEEIILDAERYQSGDHNLLPHKNHQDERSISSDNNSGARILAEYDKDQTLEIKQEIIQDEERHQGGDHNLLPDQNHLSVKFISSDNDSDARTLTECDYAETLEVKQEIIPERERHQSGDRNLLHKNQLEEKSFFSGNNSGCRTLIEYDNDETLEIKEEIIQDQERHLRGEHNLLPGKNQLKEKSIFPVNNFVCRTLIEYDNDETLEIKEEIVQDRENIGQIWNKKYGLKFCTVDIRAADIFAVKIYLRSPMQQKMREFKLDKKTNSKILQARRNCDKCARSYTLLSSLYRHKRLEHAIVKPQFVCDVCRYKTNNKSHLTTHISELHTKRSKASQAGHNCDKCGRSYSWLKDLKRHNRLKHAAVKLLKHAAVKPQFICDVCGYKTNSKGNLLTHISVCYFKMSTTSQARHNCNKCFRSYGSLSGLKQHDRSKHAPVKPQFICDECRYKTDRKASLSKHISVCHFKMSTTSQPKHNCGKCFRSYSWLSDLKRHDRLKHALVRP